MQTHSNIRTIIKHHAQMAFFMNFTDETKSENE